MRGSRIVVEQEMMRERRSKEEQGEQNRRGEERAQESRTLFKRRNSRTVEEQGEQKTGMPGEEQQKLKESRLEKEEGKQNSTGETRAE